MGSVRAFGDLILIHLPGAGTTLAGGLRILNQIPNQSLPGPGGALVTTTTPNHHHRHHHHHRRHHPARISAESAAEVETPGSRCHKKPDNRTKIHKVLCVPIGHQRVKKTK
mmetsp:Transcript_15532/g.28661  ORF Transcript_15532/g.28661 Transcript_15532/m.28661 type:complete len:111 (+) Transcript_15532:929-1261(+)